MRRKAIEKYPKIIPVYPRFFWKTCRFCMCDFRKEKGFKITEEITTEYGEHIEINTYSCNRCTSNIEQVEVMIKIKKAGEAIIATKSKLFKALNI